MNCLKSRRVAILYTVALSATGAVQAAGSGTAVVEVEVQNGGEGAVFHFAGVVRGAIAAGASLSAGGLREGAYTTAETSGAPGYRLLDITCDDENSAGYASNGTARFIIDGNETVSCIYRYRRVDISEVPSSSPVPDDSEEPSAQTEEPAAPPSQPPPSGEAPETTQNDDCTQPDRVPREGVWMVSNLPGQMVCAGMSMPLKPSQEPGNLVHRDCGRTVIGSGFSDDTADIVMRAVDQSGSRYVGTVGGSQDGIPMTIDFEWHLQSDSFITGSLYSQVTQQGMTCTMSRPFEMRFADQ